MEVTTKKEPKVKVKGNGMNGKIIVQARKFYREIPVVLFSSEEALLSTGNCKIINLSEENILWGFKI